MLEMHFYAFRLQNVQAKQNYKAKIKKLTASKLRKPLGPNSTAALLINYSFTVYFVLYFKILKLKAKLMCFLFLYCS